MLGKEIGESSRNENPPPAKVNEKLPVRRKIFSPKKDEISEKVEKAFDDEHMLTDDFEFEGESSLNINCSVVFVLPFEYDQITEVEDDKEADKIEMTKHKWVCYKVMNNGAIEEQNAL